MKIAAPAVFIFVGLLGVLSPLDAQKLTLEDCVLTIGKITKKEKEGGEMSANEKKHFKQCNIVMNPSKWTGAERLRILRVMSQHPEIFGKLPK